MKLSCSKCKKILTTDLRPVKVHYKPNGYIMNIGTIFNSTTKEYGLDPEDIIYDKDFSDMKSGIFFLSRGEAAWNNKYCEDSPAQIIPRKLPEIVVGGSSIVEGVIPPYYTGCGCCNHGFGSPLRCSCGNLLGGMSLDCFELDTVEFIMKNVDRVYK